MNAPDNSAARRPPRPQAVPDWAGALERARRHAPYLATALDRMPDIAAALGAGDMAAARDLVRDAGAAASDPGVALRRERRALSLALAIGDLAGALSLGDVTGALSDMADRALDVAIADALRRRVPDAEPAGFIALALGKHGARELNFSSDIDPILLYDPQSMPRRTRDDPGEAAQRVARTVVETLSRVTDEGYVFRVDLRLRPASEVSPLAIPVEAALTHYESSALAWERAAFIRARACAGDVPAGAAFLAAIRPFVWRRSLDFGAIAEIGRLTRRIRASTRGPAEVGPGFDLKKGRGGIREVEFYAQVHQLIHGGRNPSLRLRGTRATLDALAQAQVIPAGEAAMLGESYDRLRTIEHRLQMMHDHQTHALPLDGQAIDAVARLDGLPEGAVLIEEVRDITARVGACYDALIEQSAPQTSVTAQWDSAPGQVDLDEASAAFGMADAAELSRRLESWQSGRMRALRSDAAQGAFAVVRPALIAALAAAPEPARALARWERLLTNLPSAINLFRLLEARPALLDMLARILSIAPPLADALARRADLLDPLIDASAFDLPGSVEALAADFTRGDMGSDYEALLDRVRHRVGELRFVLGVQLIEGRNDPLDIGRALARIAQAAVRVLLDATRSAFEARHGRVEGGEMVLLGLGRLGGGILTHASDLDVVFLFTGQHTTESSGERPLGATLYFNRLAQRSIAALSAPTAEGALYEIDTRLRPSGEQGPPASSVESFVRYQNEQAWTWEHMALCRARALYGSAAARGALDDAVRAVLLHPRDPATLRRDVLEMRAKMACHKPAKGLLDVKLARGGLVDLEFLVHHAQLASAQGLDPRIDHAIRVLECDGLLPAGLAGAYEVLARLLVAARLLAPDAAMPPPAARLALVRSCGYGDWDELQAALGGARAAVAAAWGAVFGQTLEID